MKKNKNMKYPGMLLLVLLIVSCGAPRVTYDYDKNTDFGKYKTYNFYPEIKTGLSELDNKRLFRQTDSILQSKGFKRTATPDFFVNISVSAYEDANRNTVGVGVGGGGRNVGGGISIGLPIGGARINQELIFDFVDVRKDELFWQAVAQGHYKEKATPEQRELYFKKVVEKVFSEYPAR